MNQSPPLSLVHHGLEPNRFTIGAYVVGPEIGKGSFATVYKCTNTTNNKAVAIKSVFRSKLKSKKLIENLEIEISILKSMKHPHIVGLLDYNQTSTHFHLVMDYCSMGDLSYFIRKRNQLITSHPIISSLLEKYPSPEGSHGLNEVLVLHFLRQLSSALMFLRDKSLVHRDIKPQNLLLCPPVQSKLEFKNNEYVGMWELPILKIADFGFARFLPSTSMAETLCGSPLYMAPEILRYEKYNAKADLWSVGAVLYEMTVGKPPFKAGNHIELLKNIEKANDKIKFPSAAKVSESLKQLIKSLLKYNPTERVSFTEFFNDPLLTYDLGDSDKPLNTSEIDENLFISEYISPIKSLDRKAFTAPLSSSTKSYNSNVDSSAVQKATIVNKSQDGITADDEIKKIIDQNSPEPEYLMKVVDKAPTINFKSDMVLEKEYVVVEKRAVEVNALADELASVGTRDAKSHSVNKHHSKVLNEGSRTTQTQPISGKKPMITTQRRPSFTERRISISISPTNALSKAIGLASNRLFGVSVSEDNRLSSGNCINEDIPTGKQPVPSNMVSTPNYTDNMLLQNLRFPTSETLAAASLAENKNPSEQLMSDELVLSKLESIATKSHAIYLFADVKFTQLIPSPPSVDRIDDNILYPNDMLPPKIMKTISEEGVALYVKTLSLLAKGMSVASEWWYSQFESTIADKELKNDTQISSKINQMVQWIREKFNECLEKAELVKLRLQEANFAISQNEEPGNESPVSSKVVAEKLIFDRALEMSRSAAVNELVREDLKGCELAYSTAIWMLEALLDEESTDPEMPRLDADDKAMVEKFIVSIGNRLSVLKKKIDVI